MGYFEVQFSQERNPSMHSSFNSRNVSRLNLTFLHDLFTQYKSATIFSIIKITLNLYRNKNNSNHSKIKLESMIEESVLNISIGKNIIFVQLSYIFVMIEYIFSYDELIFFLLL